MKGIYVYEVTKSDDTRKDNLAFNRNFTSLTTGQHTKYLDRVSNLFEFDKNNVDEWNKIKVTKITAAIAL